MTCRKVTWTSKKQAKLAARRYLASQGGHAMQPYFCEECDRWHIGHNPAVRPIPCRKCGRPMILGPASWGGIAPLDPDTGRDHRCRRAA